MSHATGSGGRSNGAWVQWDAKSRARLLQFSATSLAIAFASFFIEKFPVIRNVEDLMQDFACRAFLQEPTGRVAIVAITEREYRDPQLFGGASPLNPATLTTLVTNIGAMRPAAIVLDVLIEPRAGEPEPVTRQRVKLYGALLDLSRRMPVILAAPAKPEPSGTPADSLWNVMVGVAETRDAERRLRFGDPRFENGVVRRVHEFGDLGHPSLMAVTHEEVARLESGAEPGHLDPEHAGAEHAWDILFTRRFPGTERSAASTWLPAAYFLGPSAPAAPVAPGQFDRTVLVVGGDYTEGRDEQLTALGPMPGVLLWADAIESRLANRTIHHPPRILVSLTEFLLGILTSVVLLRHGAWAGIFGMAVALGLAQVASLLLFGSSFLWFSFLPASLGVLIHRELELNLHVVELEREVERLRTSPPER